MPRRFACAAALSLLALCAAADAQSYERDVVVYGGTSGAVTAAVQAARMGKSVALIDPGCYVGDGTYVSHLGGLSSGGLGRTDVGDSSAIGGLAYDFYRRENLLGGGSGYNVHAGKAEQVFDALVAEAGVQVFRNEHLDRAAGVAVSGTSITSIATTSGKVFGADTFIDGTYEGDLLAAAGVSYAVGREARSVHGETYNGIAYDQTREHVFGGTNVDPYVTPGDPGSGLLAGVHRVGQDPRGNGAADQRIQAYCYRMTWTKDADRAKWTDLWGANGETPPAGYDQANYELHDRYIQAKGGGLGNFLRTGTGIGGGKTDINNWGPCSSDFIGGNYDVYVPATGRTTNYAEATRAEREYIIERHIEYTKGLLYFLRFDCSRQSIRDEMAGWGLAADEFTDNGNFPHQLYVREARRMVGAYVMTEDNCTRDVLAPQPIGLGAYPMDSHNTHRYVAGDGYAETEGNFWLGGLRETYSVDYGAITPQQGEADNLLVVCALSGTHTAFGSMRMEPVFLVLGQSAGTAAARALEEGVAVQQIDFAAYQATMRAYGQKLTRDSEPPVGPFLGRMQEPFDYGPAAAALNTVSYIAPGWAEPWTAGSSKPAYDGAADLEYVAAGYPAAPRIGQTVSGSAARTTGVAGGSIAEREIAGGMAGTVWLSALLELDANTADRAALLWLDRKTADGTGDAYVGLAGGALTLHHSGNVDLFEPGTPLYEAGATHLILGRLTVNDTGADAVELWIDPDLLDLGPADLSVAGLDLFGAALNGVGVSVGAAGGIIDDLRLSNLPDGLLPTPGDADRNGLVNDDDLAVVLAGFGEPTLLGWSAGDFNGDRIVDDRDLSLLLSEYAPAAPVPAPAPLPLLALGALALLRRRS